LLFLSGLRLASIAGCVGGLPHMTRHPALSAAVPIAGKVVLLPLSDLRLTLIASCVDDDHRFLASRRRLEGSAL
jgi:hypothetical protein